MNATVSGNKIKYILSYTKEYGFYKKYSFPPGIPTSPYEYFTKTNQETKEIEVSGGYTKILNKT